MRGAVFDLDETLIDRRRSLDGYARRLCRDLGVRGITQIEFMNEFHRLDADGRIPRTDFFAALSRGPLNGVSTDEIKSHFETHAWTDPLLLDGVLPLLRRLRDDGWRLGVVTNGGVSSQTAKLTNSGLSKLVDAVVISQAFGARKPAPEIFAHIVAAIEIDPVQSWFIGDDPRADIWGAKQLGFRTCWVERYLHWPVDLRRCYDATASSMAEVLEIVTCGG
jgi:HAD superfamily hydrolase (TIGR01509 family)